MDPGVINISQHRKNETCLLSKPQTCCRVLPAEGLHSTPDIPYAIFTFRAFGGNAKDENSMRKCLTELVQPPILLKVYWNGTVSQPFSPLFMGC